MYLTEKNIEIVEEVDLNHSIIRLRSDEIVEIKCNEDTIFEVTQLNEIVSKIGEFTNEKRCKQLIVAGLYSNISREAREFMATEEATKYSIIEAYVIQSLAQRIVGNFYLKFNKPSVPTRIFTDREKAEKWLKSVDATS